MRQIMNIVAEAMSILLYPLWTPTIGMVLFCYGLNRWILPVPAYYWWVSILTTFVITALIPLTLILIGMKQGTISDIHMTNPEERTATYRTTVLCYGFWFIFLWQVLKVPSFMTLSVIGCIVDLILVLLINRRWKISAHLSGLGGLIVGVLSFCLYYSLVPTIGLWLSMAALVLALMWVRIYLKAHNELQVVAGFVLALACTFLPNIYLAYV